MVTTPAAEWREAFYRHCKRVGREGRSTVWTVDEKTVVALFDKQLGSISTHVVQAPKVTAGAGQAATVNTKQPRAFVVDVDRVADGPVDHAGAMAFHPSTEVVAEGVNVTVQGQRTADGVRARVKVDSTWVGHVARAQTTETIENKSFGKTSISAPLEMPQVVEAKVDGDYEIPDGRQMLASLGTATTVDAYGKPVVMERLLLIAARPILTEAEEARIGVKPADAAVRAAAAELPVAPVPRPFNANRAYTDITSTVDGPPRRMPPLPSRTPLQPVGPDGKVVELPPLPDGFDDMASADDASGGPQASPQARVRRKAYIDDKVAAARLEPEPVGRSPIRLDGRELASGRTQVIRIPLGGMLAIEVQARVVPADRSE